MRYICQFGIILIITCISEILKSFIPLPIPSSIYGIFILFIALERKIIRLDQIKETGKFLIEIMPIMFIPAAVGLMESWISLERILIPVLLTIAVSTFVVMAVSGHVTQIIIRRGAAKK